MATMNISLPDKLKDWVESQVAEGLHSNVSDYIRDLLRKEEARQKSITEMRAAIDEGEKSGYQPYDRKAVEKKFGLK